MQTVEINSVCSYESRLIENYAPETVVDGSKAFEAIQDPEGNPIVFAIGSDDVLRVLVFTPSTNNWQQYTVSGSGQTVTAFRVHVNLAQGTFLLAMATQESGMPRFYLSNPIVFDGIDWSSLSDSLTSYPFPASESSNLDNATINTILLNEQSTFFSTEYPDSDHLAQYFQITNGTVYAYQLPEDGIEIQDICLGEINGFPGVFLLYQLEENEQTLSFNSFPTHNPYFPNKEYKLRYDSGEAKLSSIAALPQEGSNSLLYAAGEGVTLFTTGPEEAVAEVIVQPQSNLSITQMQVAQNQDNVSIWLNYESTGQQTYLSHVTKIEEDGTAPTWTFPVIVQRNVSEFSSLMTNFEINNHLFYISPTNSLYHLWESQGRDQEGASTNLWVDKPVGVQAIGELRSFYSFNAVLSCELTQIVEDTDNQVILTAARYAQIKVNGVGYAIGPTTPITINIDDDGADIDISYEVGNRLDLLLYATASFASGVLKIDLAAGLCIQLLSLDTPTALREADVLGPIISQNSKLGDQSLENLIGGIQKLLAFRETLIKNAAPSNGSTSDFLGSGINLPPLDKKGEGSGSGDPLDLEDDLGEVAAEEGAEDSLLDFAGPIGLLVGAGVFLTELLLLMGQVRQPAYLRIRFRKQGNEGNLVFDLGSTTLTFKITSYDQILQIIAILFQNIQVTHSDILEWAGYEFEFESIYQTGESLNQLMLGMNQLVPEIVDFVKNHSNLEQSPPTPGGLSGLAYTLEELQAMMTKKEDDYQKNPKNPRLQKPCKNPITSWFALAISEYAETEILATLNSANLQPPSNTEDTLETTASNALSILEDSLINFFENKITLESLATDIINSPNTLQTVQSALLTTVESESNKTVDYFNQLWALELKEIPFLSPLYQQKMKGKALTFGKYISLWLGFSLDGMYKEDYGNNASPFADIDVNTLISNLKTQLNTPLGMEEGQTLEGKQLSEVSDDIIKTFRILSDFCKLIRSCTFKKSRRFLVRMNGSRRNSYFKKARKWFVMDFIVSVVDTAFSFIYVSFYEKGSIQIGQHIYILLEALTFIPRFARIPKSNAVGTTRDRIALMDQAWKFNELLVLWLVIPHAIAAGFKPLNSALLTEAPMITFQLLAIYHVPRFRNRLPIIPLLELATMRANILAIAGILDLIALGEDSNFEFIGNSNE